jgi:hypothetical protein
MFFRNYGIHLLIYTASHLKSLGLQAYGRTRGCCQHVAQGQMCWTAVMVVPAAASQMFVPLPRIHTVLPPLAGRKSISQWEHLSLWKTGRTVCEFDLPVRRLMNGSVPPHAQP